MSLPIEGVSHKRALLSAATVAIDIECIAYRAACGLNSAMANEAHAAHVLDGALLPKEIT